MMNLQQETELGEEREHAFLIAPDDLIEIMCDLQGEELSLEELAQVLLNGGIELEYLSERYKTTEGDLSLLMVIACQDNLEVDWADLARRCEEVVIMVVGDYFHNEGQRTEDMYAGRSTVAELLSDAVTVRPGDPRIGVHRYVDFRGHMMWLQRVIDEAPRAKLHKAAIAPKWCEPEKGPITDRTGFEKPGPDLGERPGSLPNCSASTHKGAAEIIETLLFPGYDEAPKGQTIREYSRVVKKDLEATRSILSGWSKLKLASIIGKDSHGPLDVPVKGPAG
jgi:hypothetical protein